MDPLVELTPTTASVAPGGDTSVRVKVTNAGTVQTEYELRALGPAEVFTRIVPDHLTVPPLESKEAVVTFLPTRQASVPTGTLPFGIMVESNEHDGSCVVEGDLTIGDYSDLTVRLVPTSSRGRWKARHKLVIENNGNARQSLRVRPDEDSEEDLTFAFTPDPSSVVVLPEHSKELYLVVRAKHPALLGKPEPLPFTLHVEDTSRRVRRDGVAQPVHGVFRRRQVLSKGLVVAGLLSIGLLAAVIASVKRNPSFDEKVVPLDTPTNVEVAPGQPRTLAVSWAAVQGAVSYAVSETKNRVKPPPAEDVTLVVGADNPLDVTTNYCFTVTAIPDSDKLKKSDPSVESCATPSEEPPLEKPAGVTAAWVSDGFQVSWASIDQRAVTISVIEGGGEVIQNVQVDDLPADQKFVTAEPNSVDPQCIFLKVAKDELESPLSDCCNPEPKPVPTTESSPTTEAPSTTGAAKLKALRCWDCRSR